MDFPSDAARTASPAAIVSASRRTDCQSSCVKAMPPSPLTPQCRIGRAPAKPIALSLQGAAKRRARNDEEDDRARGLTRIGNWPIVFARDDRTCPHGQLKTAQGSTRRSFAFQGTPFPKAARQKTNRPSAFANGRLVAVQDLWGAYA